MMLLKNNMFLTLYSTSFSLKKRGHSLRNAVVYYRYTVRVSSAHLHNATATKTVQFANVLTMSYFTEYT